MHCELLQTRELQVIIGNTARNGVGGRQYCGVWSLTSKHWPFNAFGNSYAGLIGESRGRQPSLSMPDGRTCVLSQKADDHAVPVGATEEYPVEVQETFRAAEPYYLDYTLSFVDKKDVRGYRFKGYRLRETAGCCYMNSPADPRLHFLSGGEWHRYISPAHGVAASIAPSYISDETLEDWPVKSDWHKKPLGDRPFYWDRYKHRFDEPFYYGRLGPMALILVFDQPQQLRFFCSPNGGGNSLVPGQACPAWDYMWVIPASEYAVGKKYTFRLRMIYKKFLSDDDVMEEYRKAQAELGFERKSKQP